MPRFLRSPLIWSALLLFGVAFNVNVPDLGETYVGRNLGAWAAICASLILLWWQPFRRREIKWSPLWLAGLFLPAIGAVLVLAVNILGDFAFFHAGHYFLPLMLLVFALFVFGLVQHSHALPGIAPLVLTVFVAFSPQYLIYLFTENPFVGSIAPPISLNIPPHFIKPSAGFGQYNLLGSMMATFMVMAVAAFALEPARRVLRLSLAGIIVLLAIDLPFIPSKTALLGIFIGLCLLGLHIYLQAGLSDAMKRFGLAVGILIGTYISVTLLASLTDAAPFLADRSAAANASSFSTRFAMWVVGFWGFVEQPIFGYGLGSYHNVYMEQYGRYGLAEGLTYYPLVTIPHNLFIHILSETGLFGLVVIMGPLIWLGLTILRLNDRRWLVAALVFPILLHAQFEYPYIASGGHYWAFGVALVMGLVMNGGKIDLPYCWQAEKPVQPMVAYAGLAAFSLAGIYVAVSLTMTVASATVNYARSTLLGVDEYIHQRAQAPELNHPVLGERLNAITNLHLINLLLRSERYELLEPIALPYFEAEVLPRYTTPAVWRIALQVYITLGAFDKAQALIDTIEKYTPVEGAQFRTDLNRYLATLEVRPVSRPQ